MKLYQKIAQTLQAIKNCEESGNREWYDKHIETLREIEREYFPSGGGFDGFCTISEENSKQDKICIIFEWHFMNDVGYYDGWATFPMYITPSLVHGFDLKIIWYSGNNKRKIQKYKPLTEDFFYDTWDSVLSQEIN